MSYTHTTRTTHTTHTTYNTGKSVKHTGNMKMPITQSGKIDQRYAVPQCTKSDGSRDMRTTLNKRK